MSDVQNHSTWNMAYFTFIVYKYAKNPVGRKRAPVYHSPRTNKMIVNFYDIFMIVLMSSVPNNNFTLTES